MFSMSNTKGNEKITKSEEKKRYVIMKGLATGVPKYKVSQRHALTVALKAPECSALRNVLERVYANTKINYRYMAIPGLLIDLYSLHLYLFRFYP